MVGGVNDVPVIGGGPLDGITIDVPVYGAAQDHYFLFAWGENAATRKPQLYRYDYEPVGGNMVLQEMVTNQGGLWNPGPQFAMAPLAQPDMGLVTKLETTNPCILAGFVADATLPALTSGDITFDIVGGTPATYLHHAVGSLRSTSTGCIFIAGVVKTSFTLSDVAGAAQRTHPYVRPGLLFSQWHDPAAGGYSNLVAVQTW